MKKRQMFKKILIPFIAILALALAFIVILPAQTAPEEHAFEVFISFEEVNDLVMSFDPRLEPFAYEFFTQINEIIQAFSDTIYHQNITLLKPFTSQNILVIADGDWGKAVQIVEVFRDAIFGRTDILARGQEYWIEFIIGSPMAVGPFTVSTPQAEMGINIGPLFRHGEIFDRPEFQWIFTRNFPDIFFAFSGAPIDTPFDVGGHRGWSIHLRLENMRFKIVDISTG